MRSVRRSMTCFIHQGGKHTFTCDNSFALRTLYRGNTVTMYNGNAIIPTKTFPTNSLAGRYCFAMRVVQLPVIAQNNLGIRVSMFGFRCWRGRPWAGVEARRPQIAPSGNLLELAKQEGRVCRCTARSRHAHYTGGSDWAVILCCRTCQCSPCMLHDISLWVDPIDGSIQIRFARFMRHSRLRCKIAAAFLVHA